MADSQVMSDTDYNALLASAYQIRAVKFVTVASLVIFVYDHLLTLNAELDLIWKAKWGLGKVLFFLTRYSMFIDVPLTLWHTLTGYQGVVPSPIKCLAIYKIATWVGIFGIAIAEGILFLRTYALYYGNQRILKFLISFYVIMVIINVTIAELFLRSLRFGDAPSGIRKLGGCHAVDGSKIIFIDFCNVVFQETVILSFTLYKAITTFRRSRSQLLRSLYRDGIFYYIYIIAISAGNIIVLVTGPDDLLDLFDTFQRVMHGVLTARILLHVRQALHDQDRGSTTYVYSEERTVSKRRVLQSSASNNRIALSEDEEPPPVPPKLNPTHAR